MITGPLSGVKVVEYGDFISAPFCGKVLADLGAEVIKVEPCHRGDLSRHYGPFYEDIPDPNRSGLFLYLNSNKLGITLNIENQTGVKIFKDLTAWADCLIENVPRKEAKRLSISYADLREINSQLVVTSISPFGQTGPYRDYQGKHINCSAISGATHGLGFPDRNPITMPFYHYDYQAGLGAAAATITALIARSDPEIGEGQHIDLSVTDVAVNNMDVISLIYEVFLGITLKREGRRAPGSLGVYPCATYECKDGYVTATCRNKKEWMGFIEAMGQPEWSNNPRYQNPIAIREYPEEVDRFLEPWLKTHTKEEILKIAQKHRIAITPVYSIDETMNDPHFKVRHSFVSMETGDGKAVQLPYAPYRFSKTPCQKPTHAPDLGEHNEEIYCNRLGYDRENLTALRRSGVI